VRGAHIQAQTQPTVAHGQSRAQAERAHAGRQRKAAKRRQASTHVDLMSHFANVLTGTKFRHVPRSIDLTWPAKNSAAGTFFLATFLKPAQWLFASRNPWFSHRARHQRVRWCRDLHQSLGHLTGQLLSRFPAFRAARGSRTDPGFHMKIS